MTAAVPIALALLFGVTALGKLIGHPASLEMRDHLQVPAVRWRQIGVLELAGVAGVLLGFALELLGVTAAGGLALLSLGAIATHVRAGDGPAAAVPGLVALALAVATLVLLLAN